MAENPSIRAFLPLFYQELQAKITVFYKKQQWNIFPIFVLIYTSSNPAYYGCFKGGDPEFVLGTGEGIQVLYQQASEGC